jgi:hypothetical protein
MRHASFSLFIPCILISGAAVVVQLWNMSLAREFQMKTCPSGEAFLWEASGNKIHSLEE